jgi:hypothetical protein
LRVLRYPGELAPAEIAFHKGWPEVVFAVVASLAETCGTLVIFPDTGGAPAVVPPGADVRALLAAWESEGRETFGAHGQGE